LLQYDAVMHEVRNHHAAMEWLARDGEARRMAKLGFFHSTHGIRLNLRKAEGG